MNYLHIITDWKTDKIIEAGPYSFNEDNLRINLYSRLEDHQNDTVGYIVNIDEYNNYFKRSITALQRLPKEVHNYVIGYKRRNKLKVIKNRINETRI